MSNTDNFQLRSSGRSISVVHPISARQMRDELSSSERNDVYWHCTNLLQGGRGTPVQMAALRATIANLNYARSRTDGHDVRRAVQFEDEVPLNRMPPAPMPPLRTSLRTPAGFGYSRGPSYGYVQTPSHGYTQAPSYGYAQVPSHGHSRSSSYVNPQGPSRSYARPSSWGHPQVPAHGYAQPQPANAAPRRYSRSNSYDIRRTHPDYWW